MHELLNAQVIMSLHQMQTESHYGGNPNPNKRKSIVTATCTLDQLTRERESDLLYYSGFRSTSLFLLVYV